MKNTAKRCILSVNQSIKGLTKTGSQTAKTLRLFVQSLRSFLHKKSLHFVFRCGRRYGFSWTMSTLKIYKKVSLFCMLTIPVSFSFADTIKIEELEGGWEPSGQIPVSEDVVLYNLTVGNNMEATYESVNGKIQLQCRYKPSNTQESIFVFYCYHDKKHLITLSLSGWSSERRKSLYGYEYWVGWPVPGSTYGGVPVSFSPTNP
ncbi:MAG: hypothetical protein KBT72_08660 [Zhongshania sp.]|nr:hypothetical protein [Zhongshania sp.]